MADALDPAVVRERAERLDPPLDDMCQLCGEYTDDPVLRAIRRDAAADLRLLADLLDAIERGIAERVRYGEPIDVFQGEVLDVLKAHRG